VPPPMLCVANFPDPSVASCLEAVRAGVFSPEEGSGPLSGMPTAPVMGVETRGSTRGALPPPGCRVNFSWGGFMHSTKACTCGRLQTP